MRAVVLDPDDRVLLVRFEWPDKTVWAPPGGGLETGESDEQALVRELAEECGLRDFEVGPCVWTRTHWFTDMAGWAGQRERIYLVRTKAFEPEPGWTAEQLAKEGIAGQSWFAARELEPREALFSPRRLPALLRDLIRLGPPAAPIDVGV